MPTVWWYCIVVTPTPPSIDGIFGPGEWPITYVLKITDPVDSTLFLTNNDQSLFMMVDAASLPSAIDITNDPEDHCTAYVYKNSKGFRVTVFGNQVLLCESTTSSGTPLAWNPTACPPGLSASV